MIIKSDILNRDLLNRSIMLGSSRLMKLVVVGGSAALASGSLFGYINYQRYNSIHTSKAVYMNENTSRLNQLPPINATRHIEGPTKLEFNLTLFQYCSCPFCCKTRTLLDYFGVSYDIVEVNPVLRQQLKWSEKYKKVPILLAHKPNSTTNVNEPSNATSHTVYQINDSSVIASSLGSYLLSKRKLPGGSSADRHKRSIEDLEKILANYTEIEVEDGDGKKHKEMPNKYFLMLGDISENELKKRETDLAEERYWRDWTDRVLVHSLSPNIYRTMSESLQAFNNFSVMGQWDKHFSAFERMTAIYVGSVAMWLISKRLKKKYSLKDDVRESLYDNCRQWTKAIGKQRQFMGGDKPNLADLSVFGVLSSIEGCTAFDDLLQNTNIKPWYFAVKESCHSHAGKQLVQSV